MKRIAFFISVILCCSILYAKKPTAPAWLNDPQLNDSEWVGIGSVETNQENYAEKADREALAEIARQISVKVDANSFMQLDLHADTQFKQQIQLKSENYMEGQQLVGTYESDGFYYVCYRLDKATYYRYAEAKAADIARNGYAFLQKAEVAVAKGELSNAVFNYCKGLEVVEPWLFMDLRTQGVNVPIELYNGLQHVYEGLSITLENTSTEAPAFQGINVPITATLMRNGLPIANFPLTAQFIVGDGTLSPSATTNTEGKAVFYVTKLLSKEPTQQVAIRISETIKKDIPLSFLHIMSWHLPEAMFGITIQSLVPKIYIDDRSEQSLDCRSSIEMLLGGDKFDIAGNEEDADIIIQVQDDLRFVETIASDMADLDKYTSSLSLRFIRKADGATILTYSTGENQVLVPEGSSWNKAQSAAKKEVLKRLRRDLPTQLKKLHL